MKTAQTRAGAAGQPEIEADLDETVRKLFGRLRGRTFTRNLQ